MSYLNFCFSPENKLQETAFSTGTLGIHMPLSSLLSKALRKDNHQCSLHYHLLTRVSLTDTLTFQWGEAGFYNLGLYLICQAHQDLCLSSSQPVSNCMNHTTPMLLHILSQTVHVACVHIYVHACMCVCECSVHRIQRCHTS